MNGIEHPEVFHGLPVLTLPFPDDAGVRALLIGPWWEDGYSALAPVVERLASAAGRLTDLRALFLADVVGKECEVSWLDMCDITPVDDEPRYVAVSE